jgi:type III restriction enzyme
MSKGIPITKPRLLHNTKKLADLDPNKFDPIYDGDDLEEPFRITLKMEFGLTETEVHQADIMAGAIPMAQELLSSITNKVIQRAKLATAFSELYPFVRTYIAKRCFGQTVDMNKEKIRSYLHRLEIQEAIAKRLAKKISELTMEKKELEFAKKDFKLSETKAFSWRRDLQDGPCECKRTVFNYVATYNNFERRFASLGTTEQGDSASRVVRLQGDVIAGVRGCARSPSPLPSPQGGGALPAGPAKCSKVSPCPWAAEVFPSPWGG